ncbi:envoplakin a [Brachionichthys hirsutus]|uniref:envoplakin a n=1 Tax=Brachionichthys hirsutus TaxID=412623 RepID=UPI0036046B82
MFKKRKDRLNTRKSAKSTKNDTSNLKTLVTQMQQNADQVEKDILRSEDLLAVDAENDKNDLPVKHQEEISTKLGEAEGLLKTLFLDVDQAKKLGHQEAREIETDVLLLHNRWLKDCSFYRDIYEQIDDVSLMPRIDWGPLFIEKQKAVSADDFGPSMADLEKQIATHNILHKEIEVYNSQLCISSAGSKEQYTTMKKQYNNLLENSNWRRHYLNSLYEYMQNCNKELDFLGEEQSKIKKQDWSDHMADPPDVRRQYENFKNNNLLLHETDVNKIQEEGDRLVEMKHPASETIKVQRDAVRNEWQKFLNLCICQETHLDNVEEYKRYQMDTDRMSETLTKLNNSMDPTAINKMSKSATLLQLEAEEKTVQNCEEQLADLRKRSTSISPLKQRRTPPRRPIIVESLCDWETNKANLSRGEKLSMKSNANQEEWDIIVPDGSTKTFPGVCFQIPPPDGESIDRVDQLGDELAEIKRQRAALAESVKNHKPEAVKALKSGPVSSAPDPKAVALTQQVDKLDSDLAKAEQNMLNQMRSPLNRSDRIGDLKKRLRDQEEAAKALQDAERQKLAAQADLQPLLSSNPSSDLPLKLSAAENKRERLEALSDLYKKKANASLNLQNQIQKVDDLVSGFERKLSDDGPIPDSPNAIKDRIWDVQTQQKPVAAAQGDMKKLSQDLEITEQLCSSLQKGYNESCPDIQRQKSDVKQLQTRYAFVANELHDRKNILQATDAKNQQFQSTSKSLNSFLENLPTNQINRSDDLSQVTDKQRSQERVMDDLRRKGEDMDRMSDQSRDLQNLLNEYESNAERYSSSLDDAQVNVARKPEIFSLADAVEKEEKSLVNRFAETTAENTQRQKQMGLAKNIILQNEEKVQMVAQQQVQLQSQQRNTFEVNTLMSDLDEEKDRRTHAEVDLRTFKERMTSLKSRKGVERIVEKEILEYYRDPKLQSELTDLQANVNEEVMRRRIIQTDVEEINQKIILVEENLKNAKPKLVTREVTEFERDPQLDLELARLRDEIHRVRDDIVVREGDEIHMKTEVTILQQKKRPIKEKIVKKEVVKVEQDPEMLRAVRTFETDISNEGNRSKILNDEIFQTRSTINSLERYIPNIKPKVITKEVTKIEQDPELIIESKRIRGGIEEEMIGNNSLSRDLTVLQSQYQEVQLKKPKIEVKETVHEIYRVDPNTELEIVRLRKNIQDLDKQLSDQNREISLVMSELTVLRNEKPKVELKEVYQEVVKEERSPENEREIQRLNDQLNHLHTVYNSLLDKVRQLRHDRDEWKALRSKIETKVITRDVIKYEPDPLTEKEAERLRRDVRDEAQVRRTTEDMVFDLQNIYIQLEREKPEEKIVVQEVVRVQRDPKQIVEHEKLSRDLDDQTKTRRQQEIELQQLKATLDNKLRVLRESDEHQRRIQAEYELREIQMRITQLENVPPPVEESIVVEELLKVERDPKLERMSNGLRSDMDKETSNILNLQKDIRSITLRLEILRREKSGEKTVYKEIVRVEKDQAVEAERDHLREQVSQQKFGRQDLEDEIRRVNDKMTFLKSSTSSSSREENTLILNKDGLMREREDLTRELRALEARRQETSLSFQQQSRLMSERAQMSRHKSQRMESDTQHLEREILDEKDKIHQRDITLRELLQQMQRENQAETRTKETNVSTKITILDPDTGKDMSPYDAYLQGLIDRQQYIQLQELECDWEEITSTGREGGTSVLQDRKSGKQYSINDALKEGRLTEYDVQQYKKGKMSISEFALLVAGDNKKQAEFNSVIPKTSTTVKSNIPAVIYPVAGIMDTQSDTCFTIRSATSRKLIDSTTAQKLLEAQASTGGIIDISTKERYTVQKAAARGLIEDTQLQRLLNAQKAYSGIEEPVTRECLSVGEAVQKGWMPKDNGTRYMEIQHLTGGLVNPRTGSRISLSDAIESNMIDSTMLREIQTESNYIKDIVDPITKEKINYKQALDRCKTDPSSGLPMLPASSKNSSYIPSYYSTKRAIF